MSAIKSWALGLGILILVGTCCFPSLAQEGDNKLRGDLPGILDRAGEDELVPVFFVLSNQLTGPALLERAEGVSDPDQRRRSMIQALKQHAATDQSRLREMLVRLRGERQAQRLRYLWIGNIVAADLTPRQVRRLAALPEVGHVSYSPKVDVSLTPPLSPAPLPSPLADFLSPAGVGVDEVECGVELMRAPEVWNDLGVTGEGAVVAVIDSGVCWYHPDIENQIWVNPGEDLDGDGVVMDADDQNGVDDDGNGYIDDLIGYDIENGDNDPNDNNSHGSHCAGSVAGDGTSGTQAGVAPDAGIMPIRVGLTFSDEPDVWEGMQYAADNGADAITMSLGWPHSQNPDRATWRTNCENTIDLGTAMVIAAGNEGSGNEPDNIRTPGDVPRIISVAAVNCSDSIASFSSRGPVTWQDVPAYGDHPYPPGLTKPDVAGPGVDTKSHNVCSGYSFKSGTSMATPHVAGAVALILSRNPALQHDDLKLLLEDTAVDLGDPGKDNVYGSGRVDAYEAALLAATSNGSVSIREKTVNCVGTLTLTVSDEDLQGNSTVTIDVSSDTEPGGETVTLNETGPDTGVFRGTVDVGAGDPIADGVVQVIDGDLVTATYIDADDGEGGLNVTKTDTANIDCTKPVVSNVRDENVSLSGATIRWTTDEASTSKVIYDPTIPPATEANAPGYTTSHSVSLSGLAECTVYYYSVASEDPYGNLVLDDNGGNYYHFETLGDFGEGPQTCHGGRVSIEAQEYSCADTVSFFVTDLDLNLDSQAVDTTVLEVSSSSEISPELVEVTETGPNSSKFSGAIPTGIGAATADGVLQVEHGDVITVSYVDADDGTGARGISFDTATVDCVGAAITDIGVESITDARATILWSTDELTNTVLDWGRTPALGNTVSDSGSSMNHSVMLNKFSTCERIYFRIRATDEYGSETVADNHGEPFSFSLGEIPGLYWKADFESGAAGWTLDGEWEIGPTQGLGGSSGDSDPLGAYNNDGVLGHDLSGLGSWSGDYEPDTSESATTPTLDASSWTNTRLMLYRNLHVGAEDDASLWLWTQAGRSIYRNDGAQVQDDAYVLWGENVGALIDGAPEVRLEFKQTSDSSGQYAGWTVDEIVFKDGTLPDFGSCADCSDAPSFAGVVSANDNNACGADGVTVSWNEVVSWGTGSGGSFAIYRDASPGFAPSASTLIASGVGGLSYNDASAPTDQQLYYIVRAESDESCGGGPNNGGSVDSNLVVAGVSESTSQPVPGAIDNLNVQRIARAHVRLEWTAPMDAATYHIYRSEQPDQGFVQVGQTTELVWDDLNVGADKRTFFYAVRAANACGIEGL